MPIHYLDNAATTQPSPISREAFLSAEWGNPSSLHDAGYAAEKQLTAARGAVAKSLGCAPGEVIFTSGGTEANTLALLGGAETLSRRGKSQAERIITTDSEHPSVKEPLKRLQEQGFEVLALPTKNGVLPLDALEEALNEQTILVSVMLTNNETGAIYPVERIAQMIRQKCGNRKVYVHCDAVQAYLKTPIDVKKLGVDLLTASAHKVGGYKGTGALYLAPGTRLTPRTLGGGQEGGLRPGTENLPGICAMGAAATHGLPLIAQNHAAVEALRSYTLERLTELAPAVRANQPPEYSPYVLSLTLPGIRSEIMLQFLSSRGVYVSSGSACSAKSGEVSPTLLAYGLSRSEADCTIRVSFSPVNTHLDVDALAEGLKDGCSRLVRVRLA